MAHWKIKGDMHEQIKQSKQCKIVLDHYDGMEKKKSDPKGVNCSLELGLNCHEGLLSKSFN